MENHNLGLDLLTNPRKLKKQNGESASSTKESVKESAQNKLIEEFHTPKLIDNSIKCLIETLTELIKYKYHLRNENNIMAREIIYDLLPDETFQQLKSLELDF